MFPCVVTNLSAMKHLNLCTDVVFTTLWKQNFAFLGYTGYVNVNTGILENMRKVETPRINVKILQRIPKIVCGRT